MENLPSCSAVTFIKGQKDLSEYLPDNVFSNVIFFFFAFFKKCSEITTLAIFHDYENLRFFLVDDPKGT
jgi:hypothetical protein